MEQHWLAPDSLIFALKPMSKGQASYSSIYLFNESNIVLRLRYRVKNDYFSFPAIHEKVIPSNIPMFKSKSEPGYIRIAIEGEWESMFTETVIAVLTSELAMIPAEWGCCSRYEECSDARRCLHPDKVFSMGCSYRRNLLKDHIFYGVNANKRN